MNSLQAVKNLHTFFKALIAILAFFPGIAVYSELVEAPPDFVGAAKIISFSIAIMALICVPLLSDKIMALTKRKVALFAVLGVILGGASLMLYMSFAKTHIFPGATAAGSKKFIIPLYPNRRTLEIVDNMGTRRPLKERYSRAIESGHGPDLIAELDTDSWDSFGLMVVLLMLSQVLLVVPPVAAAWRLAPQEATESGDAAQA
jgi:hypothetical protein